MTRSRCRTRRCGSCLRGLSGSGKTPIRYGPRRTNEARRLVGELCRRVDPSGSKDLTESWNLFRCRPGFLMEPQPNLSLVLYPKGMRSSSGSNKLEANGKEAICLPGSEAERNGGLVTGECNGSADWVDESCGLSWPVLSVRLNTTGRGSHHASGPCQVQNKSVMKRPLTSVQQCLL